VTPYSLDAYRAVLRAALAAGRRFVPFDAARTGSTVFLRHDVDYSPTLALRMAQVNAELGVAGTFFLLLRSQVYNLLSEKTLSIARQIAGLNQHIGLHFAPVESAPEPLEERLREDHRILSAALPGASPVFAWHNPTPEILSRHESMPKVAGLINAYSAGFIREISYYADSNMRHPVETFLQVAGQEGPPVLQLAFHPLNWVIGGSNMLDVFSGTWQSVVRERELEFRTNAVYSRVMPEGMPEWVLRGFVEQWRKAADQEKSAG
jgi:hypothetical protein